MKTESDTLEASATSRRRWAWLAPVLALAVASVLTGIFDDVGLSVAAVVSLEFLVGVAGGFAWQALYPRDLVARFGVWAAFFTAAALIGLIPGAELDTSGPGAPTWWPLGVLAGVVLAESRRRRTSRA